MPNEIETCTFQGTAAAVHIQGKGAAVLLNRALYEHGNAKRVILVGAQIGTTGKHNLDFNEPESLSPVADNPPGTPYQVHYRADGPLFTAHVLEGGGKGSFQGKLKGFPECEANTCEILWVGPSRTIKVERATRETMMAAEGFVTSPGMGPTSISLEEAKGKFKCTNTPEAQDVLDTQQIWTGGETSGLSLAKLSIGPAGIELTLESHLPPDRTIGMPLGGKLAITLGPLIGLLLILFFTLRKKPAPQTPASR